MNRLLFAIASTFAGITIAMTSYAIYDVLKRGEFVSTDLLILMFGCFILATIFNPTNYKEK